MAIRYAGKCFVSNFTCSAIKLSIQYLASYFADYEIANHLIFKEYCGEQTCSIELV